jgi:hypothetical protein
MKHILSEGMPRGFLSNYISILSSFYKLKNVEPENIFISSNMFSLYGHPSNWFNEEKIFDGDFQYHESGKFWSLSPWPTDDELIIGEYKKYFDYNERCQTYLNDNLHQIKNCLGVHYRGTDHNHTNRVPFDTYINSILDELKVNEYNQIFICTDEDGVIEAISKILFDQIGFTNILYNNTIKSKDNRALHFSGHNEETKVELGNQVLLDSHSISKCDSVICKTSNIINYARILNPNLKPIYQDKDSQFIG